MSKQELTTENIDADLLDRIAMRPLQRVETLRKLMPEINRRFNRLLALLDQALNGDDVPEHDLRLASGDLLSAVGAAWPEDEEE